MDHKPIYEATKLRTIKTEPKSATDWQHDYEMMTLRKKIEDFDFRLSKTEGRMPRTTNSIEDEQSEIKHFMTMHTKN